MRMACNVELCDEWCHDGTMGGTMAELDRCYSNGVEIHFMVVAVRYSTA